MFCEGDARPAKVQKMQSARRGSSLQSHFCIEMNKMKKKIVCGMSGASKMHYPLHEIDRPQREEQYKRRLNQTRNNMHGFEDSFIGLEPPGIDFSSDGFIWQSAKGVPLADLQIWQSAKGVPLPDPRILAC
jgi:hypothetical protein